MTLPVRVVELVLPYPPRMNDYWRMIAPKGKGRPHMTSSEIGKAYKAIVRAIVRKKVGTTLTGPLRFHVDVFRPRASGDVDGHVKVLLDALQRKEEEGWPGLYLNDSQGVRVAVEHWDHQPNRPRVQLTVVEDSNPRRVLPQDWPISPAEQAEIDAAHEAMAAIRKKNRERTKAKKVNTLPTLEGVRKRGSAHPMPPPTRKKDLAQLARPASYPARKARP
jgi:Holliday junction resolvase RusA-like endonuclease